MKLNNRWITIFIVIIIGLIGCNIYLAIQNKNIHNNKDNNKISKKSEEEKYYDCSFTKTYRVVDLLDGYIAEVPEESYIVVDASIIIALFALGAKSSSSALTTGININKKISINIFFITHHLVKTMLYNLKY